MFIRASSVGGFDFEGLQIRDYTAGLEGRSSVAEVIAPPRSRHRRARSLRSDKVYWVLEGTLSFEIDGTAMTLGVGDLAIVPQGAAFAYQTSDVQARVLLIHTPPFASEDEVFLGETSGLLDTERRDVES